MGEENPEEPGDTRNDRRRDIMDTNGTLYVGTDGSVQTPRESADGRAIMPDKYTRVQRSGEGMGYKLDTEDESGE